MCVLDSPMPKRVFLVAKGLFDREATTIELDDLRGRQIGAVGRKTPSMRHSGSFHADYGADFAAVSGDTSFAEQLRPAVCRYPFGSGFGFAIGALHQNVVAKANHEAEPQTVEMLVACLVAETPVSEQRDSDVGARSSCRRSMTSSPYRPCRSFNSLFFTVFQTNGVSRP